VPVNPLVPLLPKVVPLVPDDPEPEPPPPKNPNPSPPKKVVLIGLSNFIYVLKRKIQRSFLPLWSDI